jgi:hypothetical protein
MRRYFEARGELDQRTEMITTIFSHPCDAATPMVAGFKVITVMPDDNGYPDLEAFKAAVSEKTVGCMITNPEDTGIYNPQIDKYVEVLHDAGALAFTAQANANGSRGYARARDAGFDACHFNLHKTFSSPHGCEGPATGAYMCTEKLAPYLPVPVVTKVGDRFHLDYDRPESIGRVRGFLGNWMGVIRAYAWIRNMGPEGLKEVAEISVLNNNYLDNLLMAVKGVSRPYAEGPRRLDQVRYSLEQAISAGTAPVRLNTLKSLIFNDLAFSFYNTVETAKITLSSQGATVISLAEQGLDLWELYTRAQFEQDIAEAQAQIEQVVLDTVAASGLKPGQIEAVVKTGGSSAIPVFTEMLGRLFGPEKVIASNPFSSVTAGLAIRAWQGEYNISA